MVRAAVLTGWSEIGPRKFRPAIVEDYGLKEWTDITGQPSANIMPEPNLFVLEIRCEPATLDAIEADGRYCVLIAEEVLDGEG